MLYITRNKRFQFTVFNKNCTQENVKCHIQHEEVIVMHSEKMMAKYLKEDFKRVFS